MLLLSACPSTCTAAIAWIPYPGAGKALLACAPELAAASSGALLASMRKVGGSVGAIRGLVSPNKPHSGKTTAMLASLLHRLPLTLPHPLPVQGCVVHKAWVKSNFKQGGSVRRIQLGLGANGRAGAQLLGALLWHC